VHESPGDVRWRLIGGGIDVAVEVEEVDVRMRWRWIAISKVTQ
jgi:hypothetical protein